MCRYVRKTPSRNGIRGFQSFRSEAARLQSTACPHKTVGLDVSNSMSIFFSGNFDYQSGQIADRNNVFTPEIDGPDEFSFVQFPHAEEHAIDDVVNATVGARFRSCPPHPERSLLWILDGAGRKREAPRLSPDSMSWFLPYTPIKSHDRGARLQPCSTWNSMSFSPSSFAQP